MVVVTSTLTGHSKSVCNRCVIEDFSGVLCCQLVFEFSVGIGAVIIGLSHFSFFFTLGVDVEGCHVVVTDLQWSSAFWYIFKAFVNPPKNAPLGFSPSDKSIGFFFYRSTYSCSIITVTVCQQTFSLKIILFPSRKRFKQCLSRDGVRCPGSGRNHG